jgi:hypothetical protein
MLRRALPTAALGSALALGVTGWCGDARAQNIDEGVRFKSVLIQGNPLGFIIGRYSLDLEYVLAPHHAIHATAIFYYALPGTDDQLSGPGAELGYRFYTGRYGPHGFFAGASFLVGEYEYIHGNPNGVVLDPSNDTQYVQLGGAIDAGYQLIVLENLAVGAGVGGQYTVDTIAPNFEFQNHPYHDLFYGAGLRPRVLLQIGAAF